MILYFRASFWLFSNILTSFRRGGFTPTRKRTTEILTQIRPSFCKRRSKSFIEKLSDFTFAADFGHEKNSLFGPFYFQNQLILARQYEKLPLPREGLAPNNDPKNCSENITAAPAARCCMQYLFLKLSLWSVSQFGFFFKHKATVSWMLTYLNVK